MTSSIMGNAAVPVRREEEHLVLPIVAVQWPAMREHNCFSISVTPVFVVDLGIVLCLYERHLEGVEY